MASLNSQLKTDYITQAVRNAQAEAIRNAKTSVATPETIKNETASILQNTVKKKDVRKTNNLGVVVRANAKEDTRTAEQKMNAAQRALNIHNAAQGEKKPVEKTPLQKAMDDLFRQPAGASVSDAPVQMDKSLQQPDQDARRKELEATVEHYRQQMDQEESQRIQDADMKEIESWSDEDREQLRQYISSENKTNNLFVNSNPLLWFGANKALGDSAKYLYGKYGEEKTKQLASSYSRYLNEEEARKIQEDTKEAVNRSTMSAIGHNILGVGTRLFGGLQATADRFGEALDRDERYPTLAPFVSGDLMSLHGNTVTAQTAQNIAGEDGGILRQGAAYLYQCGMTMVDSFVRAAAGGGAGGATALAACNAFSQTVSDASRQGATPEQAYTLGAAVAGVEYLSEKIPMDELLKTAKGGVGKIMPVLIATMKQAGIETTTEEISLLGTLIAEAALLQEKSSYAQTINALVANGATIEEATAQANAQVWQEVKDTAIISAGSGGMSGFVSGQKGVKAQAQQTVDAMEAQKAAQAAEGAEAAQTQPELENQAQPQAEAAAQPATQEKSLVDEVGEYLAKDMPKTEPAPGSERQRVLDKSLSEVLNMDAKRSASKQRQQAVYEELQSAKRRKKNIQKEIARAEQKLKDTGRGSQARIQQLKLELERQDNLVAQLESQNVYFTGDYERTLEEAVKKQEGVFENAREEARQAIADHKAGRITDSQLQAAQEKYNTAGREVYRLKQLTQEQYAAELAQVGLIADNEPRNIQKTKKEFDASAIVAASSSEPNANSTSNSTIKVTNLMGLVKGDAAKYIPKPIVASQVGESSIGDLEQPAESGQNTKGIAAEQNFTGKAAYQDLLYEGNIQRDRPTDVRPMEVPKTDSYGRNVSEAVGNAYGAGITPDSMANEIEMLVQEGALGFDTRTNKESLDAAAKSIKEKGAAATRTRITRAVANGKIADGDIEKAMLLYAKYANDPKRQDDASEMMVDLATMANITGRNLQLFRLLRQMTPEGMAMTLQKEVNRSVEKLQKAGKVKKGFSSSVDPQLMDKYIAAVKENKSKNTPETEQRVKDAQNAIYAAEAAKVPSSLKAKWDAWRYMAMLGNAKTQVRNIEGNAAFMPYKEVKDKMAAAAERVFLPQEKRTKSLTTDRELVEWAKRDAKSDYVQNSLKYSAKLGDDVTDAKIQENVKVFDNKALESVRKFVEKLPAGADLLFKNGYYERSLAGFLSARGYTASDMVNGKVSDAILNEGRSYAIQEAMKATFNDSNSFSDFFAGLRYKGENPVGKAANLIAEGVLPFRRTPANIVVRFTEYSPVGLAKGAWDMATKVRNGDLSAAAAIDQIASGMTGTAALALGYFLASGIAGVKLTGSGNDEDEKRQGHQDYALEFSVDGQEYSYKIDWAAPANLPLFVGANIHNAIENAGGDADVSKLTSFVRGFATMFEPMLALSCLSSLNDLVEGVRYAEDGEALYTLAADAATSYLTQAIPALARQAAQAIPENKQMTFVNDEDPTIKDLKQTAANIPGVGAAFQTDRINAWGEKESQGNWMDRAFNSFVNPGTLKKIDSGELEKEISRLNKLPGVNVSPPTAGKKISYTDTDGEKHERPLTEEEYQALATTQGQTAKAMIGQMIKSKDYQTMDDDQKAKAIEQVYSYAKTYAETKAIEDHTGFDESWMMEIDEPTSEQAVKKGTDYIMRRVTKSELANAFSALDTAWDKGYKDSGRADDLKWAYDVFAAMTPAAKADVKEWLSGDSAKYVEAREKGVTHEQFLSAAKNVNAAKGTGKDGAVKDIDKRQAIAETTGIPDAVIDKIMKAYMGDYDPDDSSSEKTELKYDYIRHGLGLSPAQYAETYRASLDNDKKNDKIAAIMALGYDRSTATTLYNVYASNTAGKNAYMGYYEKNR